MITSVERLRQLLASTGRRTVRVWLSGSSNRLDKAKLKEEGKWAIDPLERGDAVGLSRLQDYAAGYCAKDDEQMVRVKPSLKARTLTMGRMLGVRPVAL